MYSTSMKIVSMGAKCYVLGACAISSVSSKVSCSTVYWSTQVAIMFQNTVYGCLRKSKHAKWGANCCESTFFNNYKPKCYNLGQDLVGVGDSGHSAQGVTTTVAAEAESSAKSADTT